MNRLRDDGILNTIKQKTDKFKNEYARKLNISADDIKNESSNTDIYYFNVDLKFVLKARMHLLRKKFDDKIREARQYGHKYQC